MCSGRRVEFAIAQTQSAGLSDRIPFNLLQKSVPLVCDDLSDPRKKDQIQRERMCIIYIQLKVRLTNCLAIKLTSKLRVNL